MERLKIVMIFVVIIVCFGSFFYWNSKRLVKEREERIATVESNYRYSKGILAKKFYRGKTLRVKYKIQEKVYEYRGGWDVNPNDLSEGDSISFKFAIGNPNMIITEMENVYY